jgi:alkylation response protein AidB-like acyl-CoA dehydrogenase
VLLYGNAEQQRRLLRQTIDERLFWGNALNPLDRGLLATPVEGGWRLNGRKSFTSGALGSDRLTLSAHLAAPDGNTPALLIGNVATRTPGLTVHDDWDGFGQRQTDSGSATFDGVFVATRDVLQAPGVPPSPRTSLRPLVSQLTMANLYLGIGEGAYEAARRYTLEQARPWFASGVSRAADDPYVQHRYAELWLLLRPAQLAADVAALALQHALDRGEALGVAERAEVATVVAEAKVLAHRAGLEVSSQLFELTGARSTSARLGLDRYWRNARVHTLHDPVDYKMRDIGRYRLEGRAPEPTPYS